MWVRLVVRGAAAQSGSWSEFPSLCVLACMCVTWGWGGVKRRRCTWAVFFPLLIQVFDVQRKITYKNLSTWYTELREFRPEIPCIVVANKIDGEATPTSGCQQIMGEPTITRVVLLSWAIKPSVICSSQNRSFGSLPSLPFQ